MPAPIGNTNNKREDRNEVKSGWIKFRVKMQDKSRWVKAAQDAGMNLSEYIHYRMEK